MKIEKCPFCGGEAMLETTIGCKGYDACVFCNCSASVCSVTCDDVSEAEINAITAWNRRADARQHALKTGVCPMCEDCPDGCPVETPKDSRNIVTNADRIRGMTDEELAKFLLTYITCDKDEILCNPEEYKHSGKCNGKCIKNRLDWLQSPAEKEGTE